MEARLVPAQGYEMAWVRAAALRGKGVLAALLLPLNLLIGFWQSAPGDPRAPTRRGARPRRIRCVSWRNDGVAAGASHSRCTSRMPSPG
jgi:hypothetical protein